MVRVLAVPSRAPAAPPLDLGEAVDVAYADRLATAPHGIDVVILDAAAGDGWPVDNALAAAALCRGRCALVVLCSSAADAELIEKRAASSTVAAVVDERLLPGDLAQVVKGLVARAGTKPRPGGG